jgi:hypothetical protein
VLAEQNNPDSKMVWMSDAILDDLGDDERYFYFFVYP